MKRLLDYLNPAFDCMDGVVLDQGGEVLCFIGDAGMVNFPIGEQSETPMGDGNGLRSPSCLMAEKSRWYRRTEWGRASAILMTAIWCA